MSIIDSRLHQLTFDQTDFSVRLVSAIGDDSLRKFAAKAGVTDTAISRYINKVSMPPVDKLTGIVNAAADNIGSDPIATYAWLCHGLKVSVSYDDTMQKMISFSAVKRDDKASLLGEQPATYQAIHLSGPSQFDEFTLVPVYGLDGRMQSTHYPVRSDMLQREGWPDDRVVMFYGHGDRMTPTINEGDAVMVLLKGREPMSDGIYAVQVTGGIRFMRFTFDVFGDVTVSSDNKGYAAHQLSEEQLDELDFIGRVVRICKKV